MSKTKKETRSKVETEDVNEEQNATNTDTDTTEAKSVEKFPYEQLLANIQEYSKTLGQVTWASEKKPEEDGEKSTVVCVARILNDGTKQMFQITVEEKNSLIFK